jgi:hypothetical protein
MQDIDRLFIQAAEGDRRVVVAKASLAGRIA